MIKMIKENKKTEVIVYGKSDDLIEIRGDIQKELYANYNEPTMIQIDEWKIKAEYDGKWDFAFMNFPKHASCKYYSFGEHEKAPKYSAAIVFETKADEPEIEKL